MMERVVTCFSLSLRQPTVNGKQTSGKYNAWRNAKTLSCCERYKMCTAPFKRSGWRRCVHESNEGFLSNEDTQMAAQLNQVASLDQLIDFLLQTKSKEEVRFSKFISLHSIKYLF